MVIIATTIGATIQRLPNSSYVVAIRISGRWKQPWTKPVTTAARRRLVSCWTRGSMYAAPADLLGSGRGRT